jgi:hypothetical protein
MARGSNIPAGSGGARFMFKSDPIRHEVGSMPGIDDMIKQWVRDAEQSGAIHTNPHVGKPLNLKDGWDETPEDLRMTHRILKNAGYQPFEVQLIKQIATLRAELRAARGDAERRRLRAAIAPLQTRLSLMLARQNRRR